jgi:hypothetical protein
MLLETENDIKMVCFWVKSLQTQVYLRGRYTWENVVLIGGKGYAYENK